MPTTRPLGATLGVDLGAQTRFRERRDQEIKPIIARRFPLVRAREAHELLGQGGVIGKIVLVMNGAPIQSEALPR